MHSARRIVLMSGYPASGKSTLAAALAVELDFALISKDELLHVMYAAVGGEPGDAALSLQTGRAAWAAFWKLSHMCPAAVMDSNIKPDDAYEQARVAEIVGAVVEVHCRCPLDMAKARYAQRARAGWPAQRTHELDDARAALYGRPIGRGPLIEVDTSKVVDVAATALRITEEFRRA
jgi:predicted kinase